VGGQPGGLVVYEVRLTASAAARDFASARRPWAGRYLCLVVTLKLMMGVAERSSFGFGWGLVAACGLLAFSSGSASGRGFARSVPVSAKLAAGAMAINDRGQAAVTYGGGGSVAFSYLDARGRPGGPVPVRVDRPGISMDGSSLALDDRGRAAVGVQYVSGVHIADPMDYHDYSCCLQDAIAQFRFGEPLPVATTVSPPGGGPRQADGFSEALDPPELLFGPFGLTALWEQGSQGGEAPSSGYLAQAYGRFQAPMRSTAITHYFSDTENSAGLNDFILTLGPGARPRAAWTAAPDRLQAATGSRTGRLHRASVCQRVRELSHVAVYDNGLHADAEGDVLLAFHRLYSGRLLISARRPTGRFSAPRVVAVISSLSPTIVAGGHRQFLLLWTDARGHLQAVRGTPFGQWSTPTDLGPSDAYAAAVDKTGSTMILIATTAAHRPRLRQLIAAAHQPFSVARPITAFPPGCHPSSLALTASPNGHALLLAGCEGDSNNYRLSRYAP